jgi:hypothetical protein
MFFDLNPAPTFQATVQITQPGGGHRPLPLVFNHKTRTQLSDAQKKWESSDSAMAADLAMAADIVHAVPQLPDGTTQEKFFAQLFENFPASASDVYSTYIRELHSSRIKN